MGIDLNLKWSEYFMTVNYSWLSREALEKVICTNNLTLEEHPLTIKQLRELQEYDYYSSMPCKKIINGKEEFLEIHIWEDEGGNLCYGM